MRRRQSKEPGRPLIAIRGHHRHAGRALTKLETRQLEAYSEAVVLKDGSSAQRLLEEVRLFVRYVRETLPRDESPALAGTRGDASLAGVTLLMTVGFEVREADESAFGARM